MKIFSALYELYQLYRIQKTVRAWQRSTFPDRTPNSVSEHLRREAAELKEAIHSGDSEEARMEMVDVQILLWCLASDTKVNLTKAIQDKFNNDLIHRRWKKPDEHGVVEHVK